MYTLLHGYKGKKVWGLEASREVRFHRNSSSRNCNLSGSSCNNNSSSRCYIHNDRYGSDSSTFSNNSSNGNSCGTGSLSRITAVVKII